MSWPIDSYRPAKAASFTLVPTPSVLATITGSLYLLPSANRPANGPMPPSTSGRLARFETSL